MKFIQVFFEQKLSRRFVLWFSITLSFPILGLLFFAINSFNDRQKTSQWTGYRVSTRAGYKNRRFL